MSMTNAAETALLTLLFNNTAWANIGDASGLQPSSSAGSFHVSLHTASPGETGNQTTSEISYTSYARVAVARSSSGWTISGNNASNTSAINFPTATGGSGTATNVGIGTASTGSGNLILYTTSGNSLAISSGITPQIPAGDLDVNLD